MSKLGLVAAIAALALAGYVAWGTCDRDAKIDHLQEAVADLTASVEGLSGKLAVASPRAKPALMTGTAPAPAEGDTAPAEGAAPALVTREARAAMTPEERLAALEKTVEDQRATIEKLESDKANEGQAWSRVHSALGKRFYHNMDAAAQALDLTDRQKDDMKDIAERARRELADLMEIPNDDGDTWKSVGNIKLPGAESLKEGGVVSFVSNFGKIRKFKQTKIPGSNETYAQAEKRIKDRAFGDMRGVLRPEQAKKWDDAHKDALLRTPGSGMQVAFAESVVVHEPDGR